MATTGGAPSNHPPNHDGSGGGGGGVSSPWSQIVAAAPPSPPAAAIAPSPSPVSATSVVVEALAVAVNSVPAEERDGSGGNNGGGAGRRSAWNKPSDGGGSTSSSSEVMGANSWPALLESARATAKSPSPLEPSVKGFVPELQGTGSTSPSPQRQVRDNASMNNAAHPHQRTYNKRNNSNPSSNGGHPTHLSGHQGYVPVSGSHNHNPRAGFVPNDHPQQRNSYRNRNGGPHPRGDVAHHHNYGGRRDHGHGNHDWNTHRNFNGRDNYMSPRFSPRFMRPPPPPPNAAHLFPPPPPPIRPFGGMGFSELPPPQMVYVPPPPMDSLRGVPFVPPMPPNLMFFQPSDPHLHAKIVNQIDYYFSNDNLIKDLYLRQNMDDQGWVPISLIAGFKKVMQLTDNVQIVLDAVRTSSVVEVQGDKIRRRNDWGRWIIPPFQFPNITGSQAIGKLAEQVQGITLEATNNDGDQGQNMPFGELNSQDLLSTSEGNGQAGIRASDHSASARN